LIYSKNKGGGGRVYELVSTVDRMQQSRKVFQVLFLKEAVEPAVCPIRLYLYARQRTRGPLELWVCL